MGASGFLFRGPFTGRHMLGVMVLFFGVIIAVNFTMAYFAGSTWSGLIVKNTYVASQRFDEDVTEVERMKAKGWVSQLNVSGDTVSYTLTNALGGAIAADSVSASFTRPVGVEEDKVITLVRSQNGSYVASHDLSAGQWLVKVTALKGEERIYSDVQRIIVATGGDDG